MEIIYHRSVRGHKSMENVNDPTKVEQSQMSGMQNVYENK